MTDETTRNPALAPAYSLHRAVRGAVDTLPETLKAHGMNMASHSYAHVQVVPEGGADPDVKVLWWSEKAAMFIDDHAPIVKTGIGEDAPYEFTVETRGRIMFVAVTGGVTGGHTVRVYVAGHGVERS